MESSKTPSEPKVDQVIAQWRETNARLASNHGETEFALSEKVIASEVPDGYSYRKHIYADQNGRLLMEKWIVDSLGHAWSGSPQPHKYGDPKGPNASAEIWRFFNESATKLTGVSSTPESIQQID